MNSSNKLFIRTENFMQTSTRKLAGKDITKNLFNTWRKYWPHHWRQVVYGGSARTILGTNARLVKQYLKNFREKNGTVHYRHRNYTQLNLMKAILGLCS